MSAAVMVLGATLTATAAPARAHSAGETGVFVLRGSAYGVTFGNPNASIPGDGYVYYDLIGTGCATKSFFVDVGLRPLDEYGGALSRAHGVDYYYVREGTCDPKVHEAARIDWWDEIEAAPNFEFGAGTDQGPLFIARTFGPCLQTSPTERVSVDSDGRATDGESGFWDGALSADGRFVAFSGSFLFKDWDSPHRQPFGPHNQINVRDRETNTTDVVSRSSGGELADGYSWAPALSDDGRYVAFSSYASNLSPGHAPGPYWYDVFLRDRGLETTMLASRSWDGTPTNGPSYDPEISGDGMSVVFTSWASNLAENDGNNESDVFVYRVGSQTVERVSASAGGPESGATGRASISWSGRYVAFSTPRALTKTDRSPTEDVYVRDTQTGALRLIGPGTDPQISGNGRYIAATRRFFAPNIVQVVVFDRETGRSVIASSNAAGAAGDADSAMPTISNSGRYVAFESMATNFADDGESDTIWVSAVAEQTDSFVKDLRTGEIRIVDRARNGEAMSRWSQPFGARRPELSANGQVLVFESGANNVVCDDDNLAMDVFVTPAAGGGDDLGPGDLGGTDLDYVALGDSYSSGEGIYPFLDGDAYDQPCHRSTKGWPLLVRAPGQSAPIASAEAPGVLDFKACASAVIANIATQEQTPEGVEVPLQIEHVNASTDLVSISIGGNDAEFADILGFCAQKLDCPDDEFRSLDGEGPFTLREWAAARLVKMENELVDVYRQIDEKAEGNAAIVVATYPHLFADFSARLTRCPEHLLFGPGERAWINSAADGLEQTIMKAGYWSGASVAPVIERFRGHEVCSEMVAGDEWVAGIDAAWKILEPNAASFHPTEKGAVAYADAVSDVLADRFAPVTRSSASAARRPAEPPKLRPARRVRAQQLATEPAGPQELTADQRDMLASLELDPVGLTSLASLAGDTTCDGVAVPRQQLVLHGHGFAPGSEVTVSIGGPSLGELGMGSVTADEVGNVVVSAALPSKLPDPLTGFQVEGRGTGGALRILTGLFETAAPTSECGQYARDTGQLSSGGAPAPAAAWVPGLDGRVLTVSPRTQLSLAVAALEAAQPAAAPSDARLIGMAVTSLRRALTDRLWDGDRLTPGGMQVFEDVRQAVANLARVADAPVAGVVETLLDVARDLAAREVDRAYDAGVGVSRAEGHLTRGDELVAVGDIAGALNEYKLAWRTVAGST